MGFLTLLIALVPLALNAGRAHPIPAALAVASTVCLPPDMPPLETLHVIPGTQATAASTNKAGEMFQLYRVEVRGDDARSYSLTWIISGTPSHRESLLAGVDDDPHGPGLPWFDPGILGEGGIVDHPAQSCQWRRLPPRPNS